MALSSERLRGELASSCLRRTSMCSWLNPERALNFIVELWTLLREIWINILRRVGCLTDFSLLPFCTVQYLYSSNVYTDAYTHMYIHIHVNIYVEYTRTNSNRQMCVKSECWTCEVRFKFGKEPSLNVNKTFCSQGMTSIYIFSLHTYAYLFSLSLPIHSYPSQKYPWEKEIFFAIANFSYYPLS